MAIRNLPKSSKDLGQEIVSTYRFFRWCRIIFRTMASNAEYRAMEERVLPRHITANQLAAIDAQINKHMRI